MTDVGPRLIEQERSTLRPIPHGIIATVEAAMPQREVWGAEVVDDLAVVQLRGAIVKYEPVGTETYGWTSSLRTIATLRRLAAESSIKRVILWIESPGGTVAGCYELAAAIRDLASKKVVVSYIEDFGTSAAYWYASQTQKVFANRPAIVGSIGVFGLLFDDEEFYARQGIRVIAIRSSELKGAGQPGVKVTAPQIEQERYRVMAYYGLFREAVQQGRRFNSRQLDEVSDGRIWIADDAAKVGLIDSVQTFEGCIESIGGLSASAFDELTAKHATRDAVEKRPVPRKVNFATNSTW